MDDDDDEGFEAFRAQVWALERLARKQGGFLKIASAKPTAVKAYAARLYRAASRMSFVDLPNVVPAQGEVCAFNAQQWAKMPLWDVYGTLKACRGRLVLVVVTGASSRVEAEQTLVSGAVEVARLAI